MSFQLEKIHFQPKVENGKKLILNKLQLNSTIIDVF